MTGRLRSPPRLAGGLPILGMAHPGHRHGSGCSAYRRDCAAPAEYVAVEARTSCRCQGTLLTGSRCPRDAGSTAGRASSSTAAFRPGRVPVRRGRRGRFDGDPTRTRGRGLRHPPDDRPAVTLRSTIGAQEFVDLDTTPWKMLRRRSGVRYIRRRHREAIRARDSSRRNAGAHRRPTEARPSGGLTIDFVVEFDCAQLNETVQRARDGRLRTSIGKFATLTMPSPL